MQRRHRSLVASSPDRWVGCSPAEIRIPQICSNRDFSILMEAHVLCRRMMGSPVRSVTEELRLSGLSIACPSATAMRQTFTGSISKL